jgi:hypothetical protein
LRWAGHVAWIEETRKVLPVLVEKCDCKRPLGIGRRGFEVDIKMYV